MFKQMDIFDFIEKPLEPTEPKALFERLFVKTNNPCVECTNCLCNHCANNVEELYNSIHPEEQKTPCFNCDECRYYTGSFQHKVRRKEDCKDFIISECAAKSKRKKMKLVY